MYLMNSSDRIVEAMLGAHKHWDERREALALAPGSQRPASTAFTIALSREAGAGGTMVARALGERLKWPVYDRELVQRIAEDLGVHAKLLESVDERRVSWMEGFLNSLVSGQAVSDVAYKRRLLETLVSLGTHGECIIVGRGAAQILPPESTVRVRLVSPVEQRILSVSQRYGVPREEAARRIDTTDRARESFVQRLCGKDVADFRQYDLVLNTARFSVPECADLIVEALRRFQARKDRKNPSTLAG
jgi:cytidylate kinase